MISVAEPTMNEENSPEPQWLKDKVYTPSPQEEMVAALDLIAGYQHNISAALLHMAGVAVAYIEDDQIRLREVTPEDNQPVQRRQPGHVSTRWGDGGPVAWVFMPTAPCSDMEIVCVPDASTELGLRCVVNRKVVGGEIARYEVSFTKQEKI
jgi:hypothetical protein